MAQHPKQPNPFLTGLSFASGANLSYLEEFYQKYKADPSSVEEGLRAFFQGYDLGAGKSFVSSGTAETSGSTVQGWLEAFRNIGHLCAHLNPLENQAPSRERLNPEAYGLSGFTDSQKVTVQSPLAPTGEMSWGELRESLERMYTGSIGVEFPSYQDPKSRNWLVNRFGGQHKGEPSKEAQLKLLDQLIAADGFESFLQARYLGQKRFSIEGVDALLPALAYLKDLCAEAGVEEIDLGMAHRGRLNILANFIQKPVEFILKEFEGLSEFKVGEIGGDVKYHQGYASEVVAKNGSKIRLFLCPNPSHLEAVNPVLEGFAKGRQQLANDPEGRRIIPVLVHGDASFAGQGPVFEVLNFSRIDGYSTGGTIHLITNNQIGFTTRPWEGRSCHYATDVAKFLNIPIFHVNGDDPEAVNRCVKMAFDYRQEFKNDVIIDIIGYRRYGHNETDEPGFTQPGMYKKIQDHATLVQIYGMALCKKGLLSEAEFKQRIQKYRDDLQQSYEKVKAKASGKVKSLDVKENIPETLRYLFPGSAGSKKTAALKSIKKSSTGVPLGKLKLWGENITTIPKDFKPHPKIVKLLELRKKMVESKDAHVDFSFAEHLAFVSLACEGYPVRLSGQDCQRGTFTSRQAVLRDFESDKPLALLNQGEANQAPVEIYNSPLSEFGVMGFEFGLSVSQPNTLVLWEAQFGDFANGAQVIVDQFLAASEAKWGQACGLVLLLPHGYEGMGPEHSSARLERYLQLCADHNMEVVYPTTAAQYFHLLRRQLHRDFRKPLIVMIPKSLLRNPKANSRLEELESHSFEEILEGENSKPSSVEKLIFCSGKIYFDLLDKWHKNPSDQGRVQIVRVEQLNPFPEEQIKALLSKYNKAVQFVWAQEEPHNMGAWTFVAPKFFKILPAGSHLTYVGRPAAGTTAEGSHGAHVVEQTRIIEEAFKVWDEPQANTPELQLVGSRARK